MFQSHRHEASNAVDAAADDDGLHLSANPDIIHKEKNKTHQPDRLTGIRVRHRPSTASGAVVVADTTNNRIHFQPS